MEEEKTPSAILAERTILIQEVSRSITDLVEIQKTLKRFDSENDRKEYERLESLVNKGFDEIEGIKSTYAHLLQRAVKYQEKKQKLFGYGLN